MYRPHDEDSAIQLPAVSAKLRDNRPSRAEPAGAQPTPVAPARRPKATPRLRFNRKAVVGAALAIALIGGSYAGVRWWLDGRYIVSTDDAYVLAHNTTLASKISGYVERIPVADNARVKAGDVVATIDPGDYKLAVAAARDKVATQQATVDRIGRQIVAQGATIDQAVAQLASAQAEAKKNALEYTRQQFLAKQQFASQQALEQAQAAHDQAAAAVASAQSVIDAAKDNLDVLKAQQREAAGTLEELKTAQAQAERDLSFTVIRAPVDGVFSNRVVQTGDYVQTGQRLASLVPLSDVYIDANFKETQLARIRPGEPVSISVDAFTDDAIKGRVESLSPASGAVFSLLPPDNATGNFTKIVQRLPVRIAVPAAVAERRLLRPGMSVVVSVDTKPAHDSQAGLTSTADAAEAPSLGR
jgi:membrane fusion protein, multidrug efflux system